MLTENRALHDAGFALLLLHAESKRPLDFKWQTGPRKTWDQLAAQYKPGMNLGVRLGAASALRDGGYLAVIDCDVKSTELVHKLEMTGALEKMGFTTDNPRVMSGRGNGSMHIYARTTVPTKGKLLMRSSTLVDVMMPSVKPSRASSEGLTPAQVKSGLRRRAAWEIALMGEGQQVVLPPSIHPDSGRPYAWMNGTAVIPPLPEGLVVSLGEEHSEIALGQFQSVEVDLISSDLPDDVVDQIIKGTGVQDRSAALFGVSVAMVRTGFTDDQILSVLMNRSYFLGETVFDHIGSGSVPRATKWLMRYVVKPARDRTDAAKDFADIVEVVPLTPEAMEAQTNELKGTGDWKSNLVRTTKDPLSPPKGIMANISKILRHHVAENRPIVGRDNFFNSLMFTEDSPWNSAKKGKALDDDDLATLQEWLSDKYRMDAGKEAIFQAIRNIANENARHPVKEFLDSLEWDGTPRVDTWLKDYIEARAPDAYLRTISRKFLVAMVGRIYQPGLKFDTILVFEGKQGKGKSSAVSILATPKWTCDNLPPVHDKDAVMNLAGAWVVELAELAVLKKADAEAYKSFLSRTSDRIRPPYGRIMEERLRQCVFIGTTNTDDYLRDKTGNRRFWPVPVGQCDFARLTSDRPQILAEAVALWKGGKETLWLEGEALDQATELQHLRTVESEENVMVEKLQTYLDDNCLEKDFRRISMSHFFEDGGPWGGMKMDNANMQRAGWALKTCGFTKVIVNGNNFWKQNTT